MDDLLSKLQYVGAGRIYVRAAPSAFDDVLAGWEDLYGVGSAPVCKKQDDGLLLYFVKDAAAIASFAPAAAHKAGGDGLLWFAYPKKSSKKFTTDISRDAGWEPLGAQGFEAVRQVALDDDWSALRFRRAEQIARLTRDPKMALSATGRKRAATRRKR